MAKTTKETENEERIDAERREMIGKEAVVKNAFEYRGHRFVPIEEYMEQDKFKIACLACARDFRAGMEGCTHDSRYPGIPQGEGLSYAVLLEYIPKKFEEIGEKFGEVE